MSQGQQYPQQQNAQPGQKSNEQRPMSREEREREEEKKRQQMHGNKEGR